MTKMIDILMNQLSRMGIEFWQKASAGKNIQNKGVLCLVYVIGFLLSRSRIVNMIAPFGTAFYISYRTTFKKGSLFAAAAVIAGTFSLGKWDVLVSVIASLVAITVFVRYKSDEQHLQVANVLLASFSVFMARIGVGIVTGLNFSTYLFAFIEGLSSGISALFFGFAFSLFLETDRQKLIIEDVVYLLAPLSLFSIGAFQGIRFFNLDLGIMVSMVGTLVFAYSGGFGSGALAGILFGTAACMTGIGGSEMIGWLGITGVLTALGANLGKCAAVLGYFSAGLIMSFFAKPASLLKYRLLEQIVCSVVLVFITPSVRKALSSCVVDLVCYPSLVGNRKGYVIDNKRDRDWYHLISNVLLKTGRLFNEASSARLGFVAVAPETKRMPNKKEHAQKLAVSGVNAPDNDVIKQLFESTCYDCENRSFCWEECFGETYDGFVKLARKARLTGKIGLYESDLIAADKCKRFREMVIHLNYKRQINRLEKQLNSIESDTIDCLAYQFKCLSNMVNDVSLNKSEMKLNNKAPLLKILAKGTSIAASGIGKPGDLWTKYDLNDGRTLLILIDGMGKGKIAANQSKDAVKLLKSLVDCGLDHQSCISFLNSALHLAWRPDSFVALDCLVVDPKLERAHFYKLGAPPSFIKKRNGHVLVVRGAKPPAGAVTHVMCYGTSEPIDQGDLILLVSDGVFRSSPIPARAEQMLMMRLARTKNSDLDGCIKSLINQSLRYQKQRPEDDITIVGVFVEKV